MEIRPATINDIDAIISLGNSVNEFQVSDEVVTFWPKEVLMNCIINETSPIFVAKEDSQVIGFIIANYNSSFKKAIIENIFVKPDFRDEHVGKMLLDTLLTKLKELGCEYVCSLVEMNDNIAVQFYLNNSFSRGIDCAWLDKILKDSFKK